MAGNGYSQFCPVAKATEILDQRWTVLIIREILAGSSRFNDIHRGVPRMSRTLLSQRLRQLEAESIIVRRETNGGHEYQLTDAGREFWPIIEALGRWGVRWIDSLTDDDLDPAFLLWDMHRSVDTEALPGQRVVLEIHFRDVVSDVQDWWLVLTQNGADVCQHDPGFGVDVTLSAELRALVRVRRGDISWSDAFKRGTLETHGPQELRHAVPRWFRPSPFADVERAHR
ncbi:transcriptional regulator [Hoyosella rhizosphaerae]|nr:transcriptional regulator [Hoyosella rhizosphaerae]